MCMPSSLAAFCFYNLSSIVNGLVYFNQLSEIKPLHLSLVVLGIVVLLGGVWVVSIQAGGGGVDVGPWAEEQELIGPNGAFCDEPGEISDLHLLDRARDVDVESGDDGLQEISATPSKKDVRIGPVPLDRETRSESSVIENLSPAMERVRYSVPEPSRPRPPEDGSSTRRRNSSLTSSTNRPLSSSISTLPVSPTYQTRYALRHRATMHDGQRIASHPHHSVAPSTPGPSSTFTLPGHHHAHGPLSPPLNPLGGGFQIGLSPVSPGFTIMPKMRKTRLGGLGRASGLVPSGSEHVGGERGEMERRRTVSEGDVNRVLRGYGLGGGNGEEGNANG
jgi:hypothetical protein